MKSSIPRRKAKISKNALVILRKMGRKLQLGRRWKSKEGIS
jgi:hypothetical protein